MLTVSPGLHKYSERVYEACIKSFCALPVTALVEGRFFCVHGGISPQLNTFQDIARVSIPIMFRISEKYVAETTHV
jgi:diadenosine tetraphosphatase ApaH/serine/threonine PP2A family protein phosphatase